MILGWKQAKITIYFISCLQQNGCERSSEFEMADLSEANWNVKSLQIITDKTSHYSQPLLIWPHRNWLAWHSKTKSRRTTLSQLSCLKVRTHKDSLTPSWSSFTVSLRDFMLKHLNYIIMIWNLGKLWVCLFTGGMLPFYRWHVTLGWENEEGLTGHESLPFSFFYLPLWSSTYTHLAHSP